MLVLTPTRELAAQIHESIDTYGKYLSVRAAVVFGGVNIKPQIRQLRSGVDILVATPGRLLDLFQQGEVRFDDIQVLVLDEADRMLDMGFIPDIKRIQSHLPRDKQSLLFSATFSRDIRQLAKTMLKSPVEVDVSPKNTAAETVAQRIHPVDKKQKTKLLAHLINEGHLTQVLVFTRTKHGANRLVKDLTKVDIRCVAIHGNKSQAHRTRALADFKRSKVDILVATDIAARGIDIIELPQVVNFDMPHVPEDYVHRIGRTGRAGSQGHALSLVCADEMKQLRDVERLIGKNLERYEVEGFEPDHALSESSPSPKRPPKKKAGSTVQFQSSHRRGTNTGGRSGGRRRGRRQKRATG